MHGIQVAVVGAEAHAMAAAAKHWCRAGAIRIELCGGVPVGVAAEVARSVPPHTSIGLVRYSYESVDAVATFKLREQGGEAPRVGFIILDPAAPPLLVEHRDGQFNRVQKASDVPSIVENMSQNDFGLIELYGGLGILDADDATRRSHGLPIGFAEHDLAKGHHRVN